MRHRRRTPSTACAFQTSRIRGTLTWAALAVLAPSVLAQRQFDELRKQYLPPDGAYTLAMAIGDVSRPSR